MKKLAYLFFITGLLFLTYTFTATFLGDTIISEVKKNQAETIMPVTPTKTTDNTATKTPTQKPVKRYTIHISNSGGQPELDACRSGFTHMTNYNTLPNHKMLSQHNNCGGDIVLPMEKGDHVIIENDQEYVITELRDTIKKTTTTAINNMKGNIILQSCYYKDNRMKFVALTPVTEMNKANKKE